MKTHTAYCTFTTQRPREYINITDRPRQLGDARSASGRSLPKIEARPPSDQRERPESGVEYPRQKVASHVSAMHITAGVWVNDAENGLFAEMDAWLERLAATWRRPERQRASLAGNRSPDSKRPSGATQAKSGEPLAPFRADYQHHRTGETNGDAHLKSLLVHHEVIVPVTKGKLDFGPWQQIYCAEFDGQRPKRVVVKVMGA